MGYNQENYRRIREEYETKYLRAREAADDRKAEAYLAIPELREADRELRAIKSERDKLLAQQEAVRSDCQTRIAQTTTACRKQIQENTDQCNAKIKQIEGAARLKIQNYFLDCFDPLRKSTMQFPKDVDLHRWGVSRGTCTPERPFGDLTVYRTPSGKCFHTMRGCCGATEPVCIYEERLRYATGCSKCTDYRTSYQEVPEWYREYKLLLGGAFAPRPNAPSQSKLDTEPIIKLGRDQQYRIEIGAASKTAPHERSNDLWMPNWESVQSGMKHTRPFDRTIAIEDLEYAARYFAVDVDTALQLLNEDRRDSGLPPLKIRER